MNAKRKDIEELLSTGPDAKTTNHHGERFDNKNECYDIEQFGTLLSRHAKLEDAEAALANIRHPRTKLFRLNRISGHRHLIKTKGRA